MQILQNNIAYVVVCPFTFPFFLAVLGIYITSLPTARLRLLNKLLTTSKGVYMFTSRRSVKTSTSIHHFRKSPSRVTHRRYQLCVRPHSSEDKLQWLSVHAGTNKSKFKANIIMAGKHPPGPRIGEARRECSNPDAKPNTAPRRPPLISTAKTVLRFGTNNPAIGPVGLGRCFCLVWLLCDPAG